MLETGFKNGASKELPNLTTTDGAPIFCLKICSKEYVASSHLMFCLASTDVLSEILCASLTQDIAILLGNDGNYIVSKWQSRINF